MQRLLFLVLALAFSAAQASVVTFEEIIDGTPVRDFYLSSSVRFELATAISAGLSLNELEFPPHAGNSVAYDNTGPIIIRFTVPVSSAYGYFTYQAQLNLLAFDVAGALLQTSSSSYSNNTAISGVAGSAPNEQLGFVLGSPLISRIEIRGDAAGSSFVFDDFTFGAPGTTVPEPGSLALVLVALVMGYKLTGKCTKAVAKSSQFRRRNTSITAFAMFATLAALASLTSAGEAIAQLAADSRPVPSEGPKGAASPLAVAATVNLTRVKATPGTIPNGIATPVTVTADIVGTNILPGGVLVQRVDNAGRVVRSLGSLNDSGIAPDQLGGDGRYTGTFVLNEAEQNSLRLVVSVAVRGSLLRAVSKPFYVTVSSGATVFSTDGQMWGVNGGSAGVSLYFGGTVPTDVVMFRLQRTPAGTASWATVRDIDRDAEPRFPLFDPIDGRTASFSYRLQFVGGGGAVLRELGVLTFPRSLESASAVALQAGKLGVPSGPGLELLAVNPVVNTAFMSDAVMEDDTAMTAQQILDLLNEKHSFLATDSLSDTYTDTDGVAFSPASYIKQLATTYRINPQLILVTMQKESGLILSHALPPDPDDGYMGAKSCAHTLRAQLDCGISRFRKYLTDIDTVGQTTGGWAPGVTRNTCAGVAPVCAIEKIPVTPANRATAALWQYTPVVGQRWGGTPDYGGQGLNVGIWYHPTWATTLFRNLANIVRWSSCVACPGIPQVYPTNPDERGSRIQLGTNNFTPTETSLQNTSRHGFSGRLPPNTSYTVEADCSLNTWDSYNPQTVPGTGYFDVFLVSLSSVKYWDQTLADPITAPYTFGGANYSDHLPSSKAEKFTLLIPSESLGAPFLNVVLDTATLPQADNFYPSWGECKVLRVESTDPLQSLGVIRMPN
jgi:hypothetical protein